MKTIQLTRTERVVLAVTAMFGLIVPNGVFVYFFLTDPGVTRVALTNPISLVFIIEAFFLMLLFAWLLKRAQVTRPGGVAFIVMSVLGSMVFSVPAALYLMFRETRGTKK